MNDLESERLILRPLVSSDADELFRIQSKGDTMHFLGGASVSAMEIRKLIERDSAQQKPVGLGMHAVILRSSGKLIGRCGLFSAVVDANSEMEISYLIDADLTDRGLATESASILVEHLRDHLEVNRIIALISPLNVASIRVAEKLGFTYERERSEAGEFGKTSIYALSVL